MRFSRMLVLAALLALAIAAPAAAAPDRSAHVDAAAPEFKWSPPAASGQYLTFAPIINYDPAECSKETDTYCDMTLLHIASGGPVKLDVSATDFGSPTSDFDLYVYKSDANGTLGEEVECGDGTGGSAGFDEICTNDAVDPGYYLVYVVYFLVDEDTFQGTIKVTGATPTAGGPTPPPTNTPQDPGTQPPTQTPAQSGPTTLPFKAASTIGSARKGKRSRRLAFSATAEKDISNLVVKLARPKGATLGQVKMSSFKAGTRRLTIRLSRKSARRLKAGTYQLVATGTVDGHSVSSTQAVKLRR